MKLALRQTSISSGIWEMLDYFFIRSLRVLIMKFNQGIGIGFARKNINPYSKIVQREIERGGLRMSSIRTSLVVLIKYRTVQLVAAISLRQLRRYLIWALDLASRRDTKFLLFSVVRNTARKHPYTQV